MKASTRVLGMVAAVLAAVSAPVWAERDSRDSKDSLSELTGQWWQWALAPPVPSNPIADTLGTNCMVGQRGTVWFLGGTTTGGVIRRRCSVPQGVTLFFPVINSIYFDTPNICGQGPSLSVRELRAGAAPFIDAVTVAVATFDNKPIKLTRRIRSEPFVTVLPDAPVFVPHILQAWANSKRASVRITIA